MSEILSGSSSEWMQLYQQTIDTCFGFSDETSTVPNNSADHLAPKGCISKPIRRRSRASKTTPITLLNADAKNFRSLVQQFTGCRHRSTSDGTRGPVNINFALANANNDHHYNYSTTWDHAPIQPQPFVDTKNEQQHYYQQQVSNEEQQGEISFDLVPQGFVMDDVFSLA
ncbi:hypothetical protein V6N13_062565 [Hibiscus sabdariffa]|uniref:VQ domain-containing protein n=2 Tax=Hibiscus sabdariffa TaxID=183260 RepID=A0ABR2BCQ3_9ROSI